MKYRYFVLLCIALIFGATSGLAEYQLIGKGGPDQFDLNVNEETHKNDSTYEIHLGLPDLSDFDISPENYSEICDYIYDDTKTLNGGQVFEFEGQLEVGNAYDKYLIEVPCPARLIVEDFDDITCQQRYKEPRVCYLKSFGYLVDANGDLHRIGNVKIIADSCESSWRYLGTGYLLRVQSITAKESFEIEEIAKGRSVLPRVVPDPGKYVITAWSGVGLKATTDEEGEPTSSESDKVEPETPEEVEANP